MSKMNVPDWLPDWRNESEYPDPERASRFDWGWAFLRRNPKYQKDWNYLQALLQLPGDMVGDWYDVTGKLKPVSETPGPVMQEWLDNCSSISNFQYHVSYMAEAYGLRGEPKDPSESTITRSFWPNNQRGTVYGGVMGRWSREFYLPRNECVAIFDLSLPIGPQLKIIRSNLLNVQKEYKEDGGGFPAPRVRSKDYPVYLRILDAKIRGVTHATIASAIYPNMSNDYPDYPASRKIKDHLQEAIRLRDYGYRDLFQLSSSSQ
ncbi:MAG: DUF6499 domain-containing protein [bacterium]|nr:DUF6499 domain-containing protein [bacterium]